jgi:RNA polymerase sigma-70 factor, ECF subfamily
MTSSWPDRPDNVWFLERARAGDAAALGELTERYRPYLLRVAGRLLAGRASDEPSSVVQEGLAIAVERLGQFRGQAPSQFLHWLTQIVRRLALRRRERGERVHPLPDEMLELEQEGEDGRTPSSHAAQRERAALIREALGRLPEHYQQILQLRNFEDLRYEEIARRTGSTVVAARQLWARAIKKLGEELGGDLQWPVQNPIR